VGDKLSVAVLGSTGLVGQRFVQLLHDHPWFELEVLTASERSVGLKYGEAVRWVWSDSPPESVSDLRVASTSYESVKDVDVVFSALPSSVARDVEVEIARRGKVVVSNASPLRMEPDVPLVNPEVNWDHLRLIEVQRERRGWRGFVAKNPNCTTAILTLTLKPLLDEYGIARVRVATMQALSGAGYRGVYSMDILDNIVPYIKEEEEKVRRETRKILGKLSGDGVEPLPIGVAASCHRVPVLEGHLEAVFVELRERPSSLDEVVEVLRRFRGRPQELGLPTAPERPVVVRTELDRPQPRLDRDVGRGMSVVVGRVRWSEASDRELKYLALGSNTVRGAAGAAVLIAELLVAEGYI